MSTTITTDVFCDNCSAWINGFVSCISRKAATKLAREEAKRYGWIYKRIDGKVVDLCPECWERKGVDE